MRKVSANSALYWWILGRKLMSPNWHWINFPPLVHFKSYCSLVQFSLILGPDYSCPGSFHARRDKPGVVSSLFSSPLPYGSPAVTSLTKLRICLSSFFSNHNSLLNLMCIFSSWIKGLTSTTGAQSFCFFRCAQAWQDWWKRICTSAAMGGLPVCGLPLHLLLVESDSNSATFLFVFLNSKS